MVSIRPPARLPGEKLAGFDAWILLKAEDLVRKCLDWYREYAFHKVYRAVYEFASTDLSALYFDVSKDPLYTSGPTSQTRRSRQTALYRLNLALTRLLAPVLSFTCEEVWQHTKHAPGETPSVHIDLFLSRKISASASPLNSVNKRPIGTASSPFAIKC